MPLSFTTDSSRANTCPTAPADIPAEPGARDSAVNAASLAASVIRLPPAVGQPTAPVQREGAQPSGSGFAPVRGRAAALRMIRARLLALARLRGWLALATLLCAGLAFALGAGLPGAGAAAAAATLALMTLGAHLATRVGARAAFRLRDRMLEALAADPDPVVLTDRHGRALGANPAARSMAGVPAPQPADLLAPFSADPAHAVAALLAEVLARRRGRRDFSRPDRGLRLSVHRAGDCGAGAAETPADEALLVWRFAPAPGAAARGLDALGVPVLTLGTANAPLAANAEFRRLAGWGAPSGAGESVLPRLDPALAEALGALDRGQNRVAVSPGRAGGPPTQMAPTQMAPTHMALAATGRDGQRDILFLPAWPNPGTAPGTAVPHHDFEDIPVALMLLGADGRIHDSNRLARALLGLAPGEDRHFWDVVEGLGRPVADWLADAREGRALNRPEVLRATFPAQETFVQIILRRPPGPGGDDTLVAVISDATELKSLEARFVQSQKMQAIGQLAGGVAHDFNNLLTAISGHCDLLLLSRDHFDPDYSDLVQIHQNANRAAALVRQLLAFSRKQTLKPEVFALESLLEDLGHLLTRLVGERITLTLSHDPELGPIRADRRQLEQVIMNLVVNARDAMPMGGEIRVTTEAMHLERELERGRARLPAGDYAVIRVIDEGLGIPPDLLDKIFEPFFTTKRPGEGTGLGLSTAYGIVKQMGGWIFADSTEGTGTVFSLYFASHHDSQPVAAPRPASPRATTAARVEGASPRQPAAPAGHATDRSEARARPPAAEAPATAELAPPVPHGMFPPSAARVEAGVARVAGGPVAEGGLILLVEDEAPVRAFAARALRLQGYQVVEAENGEQALDFLADPALRVDVFVSDVVMPGLDGPGWVSRALAARPGTPVVFVSGYTEDALNAALSRIPRSVFLGKPFALQDLCSAIADQLARSR